MYYVLFNSITLATRLKNHFRFNGQRIKMTHTPSEISKGGCSYSLVVEPSFAKEVIKAAKDYGIAIKGVYEQTGGSFKEVNQV